jgi:hypothetical protein
MDDSGFKLYYRQYYEAYSLWMLEAQRTWDLLSQNGGGLPEVPASELLAQRDREDRACSEYLTARQELLDFIRTQSN